MDASGYNLLLRVDRTRNVVLPIPIDFGYSLPAKLTSKPPAIYSYEARDPFTAEEVRYIQALDRVPAILQAHGIEAEAIRLQKAVAHLLRRAVEMPGITLEDARRLFVDGRSSGGGWGGGERSVDFTPQMLAIANATTDEEREQAIQKGLSQLSQKL